MVKANDLEAQVFKDKCLAIVEAQGYRPTLHLDSRMIERVYFKKEGVDYWIEFFGNSSTLFRIWTFEHFKKSLLDNANALELANKGNMKFIDAKIVVTASQPDEENTVIKFQSECHIPNLFDYVFNDKMDAIEESIRLFRHEERTAWLRRINDV